MIKGEITVEEKEVDYIEKLLQDHKFPWRKHNCSIMSYAWNDRKQ